MGARDALSKALTDFLFPKVCLLCGELSLHRFCGSCAPLLQLAPPGCSGCGMEGHPGHCPSWSEPFDSACHVFGTTAASRRIVNSFRRGGSFLAKELAAWTLVAIAERGWEFDEVTYVPSPPFRSFMRGFTPAKRLGEELALLLGISCVSYLKRVGGEPSQEHFTLKERARAPFTSLQLKKSPKTKRLLLVDDYQASGATLHHAGLLLKMEEPKALFGVTLFAEFE